MAIRYTDKPPPTDFHDPFHDMRQFWSAFNDHYAQNYLPLYLSCLNKSMNTWLNQYCPGFMHVERKPHQYGKSTISLQMTMMASQSCGGSRSRRARIG
ncbi:hypothetical protein ACHAW6_004172 [Cyclotella cf. meneghiniana]